MSFDPPPEPPPGANVPEPDPDFRRQTGPLTTSGGVPKTGAPARRKARERVIVMTFLWLCVVIVGLAILLSVV